MTLSTRKGTVNIVEVNRHDNNIHAGQGTLKGLDIVFRKFRKALFGKANTERDDTEGQFNVQYPEERLVLAEAYRNMPILLYDDATGQELCTSCFQCERVCPPQVIHITQAKHPETGKPVPAAAEFVLEYDTCMSCGYCAEVCPFDAIKMDHDFELSTADHPALDVHYTHLLRPVSYYEAIAPTMWAEVRDAALKKLQNNIKRRPGNIGVDHGQKIAGKSSAAAPKAATPAAGAAGRKQYTGPIAKVGTSMSEDKLARLMAIREANTGKRGGPPESGAHAIEADVATNAAGQVAPSDQATSGSAASKATGPVAAPGKNMSEDKLARLMAIREANKAKQGE